MVDAQGHETRRDLARVCKQEFFECGQQLGPFLVNIFKWAPVKPGNPWRVIAIPPPGFPRFINVGDWRYVAIPRQFLKRPFNPSTHLFAHCFLLLVPVAHTPPPSVGSKSIPRSWTSMVTRWLGT